MDETRLRKVMIRPGSTLLDAVRAMDSARCGITLIIDAGSRLLGVITDGDVRRAILNGTELNTLVDVIMTQNPIVIRDGASHEEAVDLLQSERCRRFKSILIPAIDDGGHPVNIYHSSELLNPNLLNQPGNEFPDRPIHVLLIGGAGYIGSVVSRLLLAAGYQVTVLDRFLYGDASLEGIKGHPLFTIVYGDTRHIDDMVPVIRKAEAVVHLAELVGDPLSARDAQTTFEINYLATALIARACSYLQVNRFIYASSCSVYGASSDPDAILYEHSDLAPVSLYAKMKINAEHAILDLQTGNFAPCIFRLGTVFGMSYRPRLDLVVNTMTAKAVCEHKIDIWGGDQWRPHVHVKDVARAIQLALSAPIDDIRGQVFNIIGANHKIDEVGDMVVELVPGTDVTRAATVVDRRNYRVSGAKAQDVLGFTPSVSVQDGVREIAEALRSGAIQDYRDKRYHNILAFDEESL